MASLNKVQLIGNLGKDPETRYLPDGTAACSFSVATSETWKDKNSGERKERTEWHNVSIIGPLAEVAGKYLHKGSKVYLEGKLATRKWQDRDGNDKYTTEVKLDSFTGQMVMLDGKPGNDNGGQEGGGQPSGGQRQERAPQAQRPASNQNTNAAPNFADMDDDIPF